jgi:hypothetical protein
MRISLKKRRGGGWILSYETDPGEEGVIETQLDFFMKTVGFFGGNSEETMEGRRIWARLFKQFHGRPFIAGGVRYKWFENLIEEGLILDCDSDYAKAILAEEERRRVTGVDG